MTLKFSSNMGHKLLVLIMQLFCHPSEAQHFIWSFNGIHGWLLVKSKYYITVVQPPVVTIMTHPDCFYIGDGPGCMTSTCIL